MTATRLLSILIGVWVLLRSVNADASGRTLIDHILGRKAAQDPHLLSQPAPYFPPGTPAPNYKGNPFPGATTTGGRLDQGVDLTSREFLAPFTGKVLVSRQQDPGWAGGGYLAIQNAQNPQQVVYLAEGIAPTVQKGQTVKAGQPIGIPAGNPYNMVSGNIETGPANPADPAQPLAQVAANPRQAVLAFYNWLRSLGLPPVQNTAGAGYP